MILLDCINKMIALCDRLTIPSPSPTKPDKTSHSTQIKPDKKPDDRKLKIAINIAEEIVDRWEYVQHINRQAYLDEGDIRLELKILGNTDLPPQRPRYKYWTDFNPETGIEIFHTLQKSVNRVGECLRDRINRLIKKLTVILKPFRIQPVEAIPTPSLGVRRYKFSLYAQWVQTFSDHQLPYSHWIERRLYDNSEPMQDVEKFLRLITTSPQIS